MKSFIALGFLAFSLTQTLYSQSNTHSPTGEIPISRNIYEKVTHTFSPHDGAPEIAAYLKSRKEAFFTNGSDLSLQSYLESPGGHHFTFSQTYRGIPIYGASIKANLNKEMRMMNVLSNLVQLSGEVSGEFIVHQIIAEETVSQQYRGEQSWFTLSTTAQWWLHEDKLIPVWVMETDGSHGSWEVVLNASNLAEIQVKDRAMYHHPPGGPEKTTIDSTGTSLVFVPDPLTSAGVYYGGLYNYGNNALLNTQRQPAILLDIHYSGSTFRLEGPFVIIADSLESPVNPNPTSVNGDFEYLREETGFAATMCYFHLDAYQRYVNAIGFPALTAQPLYCDPNGVNGADNSHFVPSGIFTRVGFGKGVAGHAEDADAIIHELAHAFSYFAAPNTLIGNERLGLEEGLCDYFATSYSRGINSFRWEDMYTWLGHSPAWGGFTANTPTQYSIGIPSTSNLREIWNTALHIAWPNVGQLGCDRVMLQELYMNAPNITLNDAGHLTLDADSMLYNGIHSPEFVTAFCAKNIFTGGECAIGIQDPLWEDQQWMIYPNPAQDQFSILAPPSQPNGHWEWQILDLAGKTMDSGEIQHPETVIQAGHLPAGMYWVRMKDAEGRAITRKAQLIR